MLCTERHSTDCFDQLDCLVSRHKRDRFTVHAGDTAFAVKTVERQREGREVFVIEMQRQEISSCPVGASSVKLVADRARRA